MTHRRIILSAVATVALVVAVPALAGVPTGARSLAPAAPQAKAAADYIVVLKDEVSVDAKLEALTQDMAVEPQFVYRDALNGFAATLSPGEADALRADPDVEFVSLDSPVQSTGVQPIAPGETIPPGIERIESAVFHPPTRIQLAGHPGAVIDTGIALGHPDLNVGNGKDCINAEPANDDNGHGTHVAGTIGAKNTGLGVAGVSPGTRMYAVKVLDSLGNGTFASVICGVDWVAANAQARGIRWVNMSLGGGGSDDNNCGVLNFDPLHRAICKAVNNARLTFIVAAGNDGIDFASQVPAAYNEVLTVTAMTDTDGRPGFAGPPSCRPNELDDRFARYSNFAAVNSVDTRHTAAGPGTCVLSTFLGNGYALNTGTSMASPHVAGTVANCLGHFFQPGPCAGLLPAQIIQRIRFDAAAKPVNYGFLGDPRHAPPAGRFYGFLVSNLGY